jgi:AcrR family transcriptional regulator
VSNRLPAAVRRNQLLETAIEVFATNGYHETTMDRVAAAAGVTKPVLYQHFRSKRDLFLELLNDVGRRLADTVTSATETASSPRDQVRHGFRAYFEFVAREGASFRLLFGDGVRADPEFAAAVNGVERQMAAIIAAMITIEDLHDADRLVLAHGILGMAEATGRHWYASGQPGDIEHLAERVSDLAWSGLRGRPNRAASADPTRRV